MDLGKYKILPRHPHDSQMAIGFVCNEGKNWLTFESMPATQKIEDDNGFTQHFDEKLQNQGNGIMDKICLIHMLFSSRFSGTRIV